MRFYFCLFLLLALSVRAEHVKNLTESNAFPDEIIHELQNKSSVQEKPYKEHKAIQIGTIASLKKNNDSLYDFTISLLNGNVITITQENTLSLKKSDRVKLTHAQGRWEITEKIN